MIASGVSKLASVPAGGGGGGGATAGGGGAAAAGQLSSLKGVLLALFSCGTGKVLSIALVHWHSFIVRHADNLFDVPQATARQICTRGTITGIISTCKWCMQ